MPIRCRERVYAGLIATALLAGCSGVDPSENSVFRNAEREVAVARGNPEVASYAKVALDDATKTLARARDADDPVQMQHLAYLAQKKAQIAMTLAEARRAEEQFLARSERTAKSPARVQEQAMAPLLPVPDAAAVESARERERQALEAARQAEERVRSLEKALKEFKVREETRNLVMTLPDVSFEVGESRLAPGVERRLVPLAEYLNANPERRIIVKGYTDNIGEPDFNLALSEKRANAVRDYLSEQGVGADRILTIGYGSNHPIASNDTSAGRRENRRVEIVLVGAANEAKQPASAPPPAAQDPQKAP